ncbi:complex I subunit 5 family protein [Anaerotignum sp. MB30-C6]|uniref:complex I subunit 5 family protein n=1 Tax=Anaerotignum sp. MB30-C6 TaxID=3070814 RepID=UPI0027DC0B0A|nr:complex I subunit 5 family protein [Anaerotignum sp. MB30-C6]WMI80205.1 complex I subunit 5 family protein [Anaerotignum sp. MB30-C6]
MERNIILPLLVFFPMVAAVLGYMIGRKNKEARSNWACLVTFLTLVGATLLLGTHASYSLPAFCGLGLSFDCDGLRVVMAILTSFIWFMTTVFSKEYFAHYRNRNRYYFFMLMTLGATLGVFLSADLYTTFIFFEIMSFTSFVLVIHEESETAIRAAHTYLAVAVIGGLVLLMGLFMMYNMAGTLNIDALAAFVAAQEDKRAFYAVGVLVLFGFGAKAGVFPLHIWLPEAHPVAPAPASALLSCILTKSGVYGMLVLSCKLFLYDATWGDLTLLLGVITMVLGAVLAVFSINLKRTLACSSLSQIGFVATAIGMQGLLGSHNALAAGGTILHVANHSLLKLVLFMSAGVVYMNVHKLNLNEIRGWGKDKPLLKFIFLMGVLGITGIPLWNGYISKTLIHESIVEYIVILQEAGQSTLYMQTVEWLFLFSGGLTLAYMTKIFVAVFVDTNPYPDTHHVHNHGPYMNKLTATTLTIGGVILPVLGIFPHQTAEKIADLSYHFMGSHAPDHAVHYFAWINLKGAVITLVLGALVYFLFIRKVLMAKDENGNLVYVDRWPRGLSLEDRLYRPALLSWLPFVGGLFARMLGSLTDGFVAISRMLVFNDDSGRVIPPEDQYFSTYRDIDADKVVYGEGFAKSLLMIGVGLAVAMLYILV